MGVFNAIGKIMKGTGVVGAVGTGIATGMGKGVVQLGMGAGYSAYNLGKSIFKYDSKIVTKGGGVNLLPFKMKKGLGTLAVGGMFAVGSSKGYADSNSQDYNQLVDDLKSQAADSRVAKATGLGDMIRPHSIDNMGATGDLVFALHNGRR